MNEAIKKILFVRSDRLGEFILSLPAIKLVKLNYPESQIYLLAKKENISLVKNIDFIDYFLEYQDQSFGGMRGVLELCRLVRKEQIDCVVVLNPKKDFHIASWLARVPIRVGYDRKWGWCLNRKIEDRKSLGEKHEVEYNIDLVKLICSAISVPSVTLPVDKDVVKDELGRQVKGNEKYIVLHPFTSNPQKGIDPAFWSKLCVKLRGAGFHNIAIIGELQEQAQSRLLEKKLAVKNFVGKFEIQHTAGFLKFNCEAFIGLDSGPMHLASFLGVPCVGLFRVSNPKRWGPWNKTSLVVQEQTQDGFSRRINDIVSFIQKQVRQQ